MVAPCPAALKQPCSALPCPQVLAATGASALAGQQAGLGTQELGIGRNTVVRSVLEATRAARPASRLQP